SRKTFPSTSSTQTPCARSATSLKAGRGYDGLTNCASASTIARPFGPGSSVLISGLFGAIAVAIISLLLEKLRHDTQKRCQMKRSDVDEIPLVGKEIGAVVEWPEMCGLATEHGVF